MKVGVKWIVGVDEAGRGPLAGPVYVGAYAIPATGFDMRQLARVRDSKQLTQKAREEQYKKITGARGVRYGVASSSAHVIDTRGIVFAVQRALGRALEKLSLTPGNCLVLLDGGLKAPQEYLYQKTIIRGDATEKVIGAASILAKVTRDKKMCSIARKYPLYGFDIHKGYGTSKHRVCIKKHGMSQEHRRTFCKNIHSSP